MPSPRLLLRLLALVAVVALLAGCRLDLDVAVDMAEDGTGTVTVTATADAELMAKAPGVLADLQLDDARNAGWTVTAEPLSDGGAQVVASKPFGSPEQATAILAEINGTGGPLRGVTLSQQRDFARLTTDVRGEVRLDGGVAAFADDALVQVAGKVPLADHIALTGVPLDQALGLTMTVTVPGNVTASNGVADGGQVTWKPPLVEGQSTPLQATALLEDSAATRARDVERWTQWALIGWAILFALIAGLVVVRTVIRHRRSA